jgi:hypothetical protein
VKGIAGAVCVLVGVGLLGCLEAPKQRLQDERVIVNHSGVIQEEMEDVFIIIDQSEIGTHFFPIDLPDEFRSDGLRVIFSGRAQEIPPNVRLVGTPLELSSIERDVR